MAENDRSDLSEDALRRLSDLQRLGQALFEREAGRLAHKHGVDDPRTQRMIRTAGGAREMLNALEFVRDNVHGDIRAAEGETVLYGRVAHENLKGAAGVQVTIEDTRGRVMRAAGSAATDAAGRFALRIPPAVAQRLAGKEYFVTVRDAKGDVLHRAQETLTLEVDRTIQADVDLGGRAPIRRPVPERAPAPGRPEGSTPTETAGFRVRGRVVDGAGRPVPGVLVRIYDRDVKFDDLLGAALTNRDGAFSATYRRQDFSEGEEAADLYFVVVGSDEEVLLSTADQVQFDAAREVEVTLTLSG